jgi:hypothetical protein
MLLKGASAGGVARASDPTAYWCLVIAQAAPIAFLVYVLAHGGSLTEAHVRKGWKADISAFRKKPHALAAAFPFRESGLN